MPQGCLAYTDSYLVFFNSSSDSRSTPIYTASHSSIDIRFDGSANLTDFVLGQACAFYSPYVYLVGTAITSSASTGGDTQQHVVSTSSASPSPSSSVTTVSTGTSLNKRAEPIPIVRIYDLSKVNDFSSPGQPVADIILSGETDATRFATVAPITVQDGGSSNSHCIALTDGSYIKAFCDTLSTPLTQRVPISSSTIRLVSFPGTNTSSLMVLGETSEATAALGSSVSFQNLGSWQSSNFSGTMPSTAAIAPLDRGSSQPELAVGTNEYLSYLRFGDTQPLNQTAPVSSSTHWRSTYLVLDNPTSPQKYFLVGSTDGTSLQGVSGNTSDFVPSSTSNNGGSSTEPSATNAPDESNGGSNRAGVIAGAVVGSIVGAALIIGIFAWLFCRRRRRRSDRTGDFLIVDGEKGEREMPLLSLLSSVPRVQQLHVNSDELASLEPDATSSSTVLEKMGYLPVSGPANLQQQDNRHARRNFTKNGSLYTLHYFSYTALDAFMRNIKTMGVARSNRFIKQYDAFDLNTPTPRGGYRFLWITSPCTPDHSLEHILDPNTYAPIDPHDFAFKAWSVFAMLEAVRDLHAQRIAHLSISPLCFYFENAETVSDWQLGDFDQAAINGETATNPRLNVCSAPEMLTSAMSVKRRNYHRLVVSQAMDIWSLGCVVYQVATGKRFQMDLKRLDALVAAACQEAGAVDHTFQVLLERMLQPDPVKRDTAENLAAYWKEANGLEDDD